RAEEDPQPEPPAPDQERGERDSRGRPDQRREAADRVDREADAGEHGVSRGKRGDPREKHAGGFLPPLGWVHARKSAPSGKPADAGPSTSPILADGARRGAHRLIPAPALLRLNRPRAKGHMQGWIGGRRPRKWEGSGAAASETLLRAGFGRRITQPK